MKEIEVEIDIETGEIIFETKLFKGKSCEDILDQIQKSIDAEEISHKDKPEKIQKEKINIKSKQQIKRL